MAVFLMTKYDGPFETDLRIRLQNGETILVSPSFRGRIDPRQFYLAPEESYFREKLIERPVQTV